MKKVTAIAATVLTVAAATTFLFYGTMDSNAKPKNTSIKAQLKTDNLDDNQLIKSKMLNAIHLYKDVQGSFKHVTPNRNILVEFQVQEGENPYSYVKVKDKKNEVTKEILSDEETILTLYPQESAYKEIKKSAMKPEKVNQFASPSDKVKDGKTIKKLRPDPASTFDAQIVTYPQQIAFWLDDNEQNYEVTGNESFLDREATVIEGKLLDDLSQKFRAENFKMWVDTETGVLLKLITTTENGEETSLIEVQEIEFDKGIKKKKDVNGNKSYKKL